MKLLGITFTALLLLSSAGCTVSASAGVKLPIKVELEGVKSCPPGQAKKGNC